MKLFLAILLSSISAVSAVTLRWDRNLETNILEYRVYIGTVSNDTAPWFLHRTTNTITTLQVGEGVFWAAVTAVNTELEESEYSEWVRFTNNVVAWTNPFVQLVLTVKKNATNGIFTVQMTRDFKLWADWTNMPNVGPGPWMFRIVAPFPVQNEALASMRRTVTTASIAPPKLATKAKRLPQTSGPKRGKIQ